MTLNQAMYVAQVYISLALMLSAVVAVGMTVSHAMVSPELIMNMMR